jgi:hypothetical protein
MRIPQDPTLQELFDYVAHHLLEQGTEADDGGTAWVLRDPEGRTCAIGCLISPRRLKGVDLTQNEHDPKVRRALRESMGLVRLYPETIKLLGALRHVHDRTYPDTWRADLARVAREYDLDARALRR